MNNQRKIPVRVEEVGNIPRPAWVVTQGFPFAPGELLRNAPVCVCTGEGELLPTQAQCLATWSKDMKHVKWLLVDFQIDLNPLETRELYLAYGGNIKQPEPLLPLCVTEADGHLQVGNGRIAADFRTYNDYLYGTPWLLEDTRSGMPSFFGGCRAFAEGSGKAIISGTPEFNLYMTDQHGTEYNSCFATYPEITLEEKGPIRTSLRIRGHHASEDGRRFCPYILRMHFFAGRPDIRVQHTFVFDQDPERIELASAGVRIPIDVGDAMRSPFEMNRGRRTACGGETGAYWAANFTRAEMLQRSDIEYAFALDGRQVGKGTQSRGWASLNGPAGGVTAVIRDAWQEYPKGLAIEPEAIDIQIWPAAGGDTLKFSTPFKEYALYFTSAILKKRDEEAFRKRLAEKPTAPLHLKSLAATTKDELIWIEQMLTKYAPERLACYNDMNKFNGYGAAKTTEFWIRCSANSVSDQDAEHFGQAVQTPVIAVPDPVHMGRTGALRLMGPPDPKRFPAEEERLDRIVEQTVLEPRRKLRVYGMIDYGDLICEHSWSASPLWLFFKDDPDVREKMKHVSKAYNNEAHDMLNGMWGFFTHFGKRAYYLAADAYGRHMADVDFHHAGPDTGLIHGHDAHHWTGGAGPSHSPMAGLMLQFYLTGNRRIFDVCREMADWALSQQEPCGIHSMRRINITREYTGAVANLLEFYQATWSHKYGDLARRSLRWLLTLLPDSGNLPIWVSTSGERGADAVIDEDGNDWGLRIPGGMIPQMLYDATMLFGDEEPIFRKALINFADRYLWGPELAKWEAVAVGPKQIKRQDPYFNILAIPYAFVLTEDITYAAFCRFYLRNYFPNKRPFFEYMIYGAFVPALIETVRRAEEKHGSEALNRAEDAYVRRITEMYGHEKREMIETFVNKRRRSIPQVHGALT